MKKFLALILAVMMLLCLAACGGGSDEAVEPEVEENEPVVEEDSKVAADNSGTDISDEQLAELASAYNEVAPLYNEVYATAEANGWLEDELTSTELDTVGATLGVVGTALTEDLSMLDDADVDALPDAIRAFAPALEEVLERVSVAYEG